MLMDVSQMNQRSHFYRHVVHQILMFDVADMPSPSHVTPSVPATFNINRRSRNDGLDLMVRAGPARRFRFVVVWVMAALAGRAENTKPTARALALAKMAIRNCMDVLPKW